LHCVEQTRPYIDGDQIIRSRANGPRKKNHLCISRCVSAGHAGVIWRNCSQGVRQTPSKPMVPGSSEEGTGANARYRNDVRPNEMRNSDSGDL
jgi:hypothetical protein